MSHLLESCFKSINTIEEVVRVNDIPLTKRKFVECWKLKTEIFVFDVMTPIEMYIGFKSDFPYSIPSFYFPSAQFGYIPHVESQDGKLCLFEDNASYQVDNPEELLSYCIKKSKTLLKEGAEKTNLTDFADEISSYWTRIYNGEPNVDECNVIYSALPNATKLLNAVSYSVPIEGLQKNYTLYKTVLFESLEEPFCQYLNNTYSVKTSEVLYITSFLIPNEAPYNMTLSSFLEKVIDNDEKRKVVHFINKNNGGRIFFKITNHLVGGIQIPPVKLNRRAFRKGSIKTCDVYLKYEKKNTNLKRLYASLYSKARVAERTMGEELPERKYAIAGLGSVGSNLVHFLNGYGNSSFTLIDNEVLSIDNIGRHLLGFNYIDQFKVHALSSYLHSIRPEQKVDAKDERVQDYLERSIEKLNNYTALFVCTGDTMSDEYIINLINHNKITIPVFFLWLEPYGIAGHLVYINKRDSQTDIQIVNQETMLYCHNVIADIEYSNSKHKFSKRDAGCNGAYTLYSGNDVLLMLSAFYPIICELLDKPDKSKCYRWVGNIEKLAQKGIACKTNIDGLLKGTIQGFPI